MSHIRSGVKILSEVDANEYGERCHGALTRAKHPYVELPTLELMFNRLDAGASRVSALLPQMVFQMLISRHTMKMIKSRPMLLKSNWADREPGFRAEVPEAFSSLDEARNSMDYFWNACVTFLDDIEKHPGNMENVSAVQSEIDSKLLLFSTVGEKWFAAFQAFLQNKGKLLDSRGLRAARALEINHSLWTMFLEIGNFDAIVNETAWDKFTGYFTKIIELASLIVKPCSRDEITRLHEPEFSLDTTIVSPLYVVAHRCRDPVIRRKAVTILYASPRQEGVWDSFLTARAVERLINIEEEGLGPVACAQDVPDWARISEVVVKFDLEGRVGSLKYSRPKSMHEKVRQTVIDTVRW